MRKKIYGALGVAALALAAFLTTNTSSSASDTTLFSLFKINAANAECCSTPINNGRCSSLTGNCYPDAGGSSNNCDSTKGNC
ncbi:hypothetical protein [Chitinophaga pinensis]|uniref:Uncharacterized protein n=1 Tax=Chitinophaga pinensis (strain ATCC 43595 / DSM 2588 / LMG 13176 / NBRC 15968 / NCIMB 11800 / UQM 2034) TaxID=485918 RepID=A0A979G391_CHIPD|nr:hypothetical protein [Chitinophaga pinensis]ACU59942.1 hypothetical protein Cpin_2454 [Chitinophaga pinensis DSM 2588]